MPTNSTLFITIDYLRDNTVINGNVDSELLEPFIVAAQNVRIESIIGTGLFNDIITNINAETITGNNKILLDDYIQPCLIQWVVYEALPFINYKLTNKAVSTKQSDDSTEARPSASTVRIPTRPPTRSCCLRAEPPASRRASRSQRRP